MLVLFDGHMTHLNPDTVRLALQGNISLVKLPAHCTDALQPLEVCCFSPIKIRYEQELISVVHQTMGRQTLTKAGFSDMICKIWHERLSTEHAVSGFYKTGSFPVCAVKYSVSRLDKVKLKTYTNWKAEVRQLMMMACQ